jgi:glycosyltransferase involved in cell wall biosynthesis
MKHKIISSLCIRNEEWILIKALDILSVFSDKIIILDDNSTDNTKEICLSYNKVDYEDWPIRDNMILRQEGLRKQRNIDRISKYNPDYVLFLDADEIPTPSIINFIEDIDENVNLWSFPWFHLWGDEEHFRVDSFVTDFGVSVKSDPFNGGQRKGHLMKYDISIDYMFDISKHKSVPMEPMNVPQPHSTTDDVGIVHYGKIRNSFLNGEKNKYYAQIEAQTQNYNYEQRIAHHESCRSEKTLQLRKLDPLMKDWSKYGINTEVNYDKDVGN